MHRLGYLLELFIVALVPRLLTYTPNLEYRKLNLSVALFFLIGYNQFASLIITKENKKHKKH